MEPNFQNTSQSYYIYKLFEEDPPLSFFKLKDYKELTAAQYSLTHFGYDINQYFRETHDTIMNRIANTSKVVFSFEILFYNPNTEQEIVVPITMKTFTINAAASFNLKTVKHMLSARVEDFEGRGSGLIFRGINTLNLGIYKRKASVGASFIKLPFTSRYVLNIQNKDQKCFLWSVLAKLYPAKDHKQRVTHYIKYEKELNMEGIDYPVKLESFKKFEKQNPSISINVFLYDNSSIVPLYDSSNSKVENKTDLLLIQGEQNESHYCLITKFDSFMFQFQEGKPNNSLQMFTCRRCLSSFTTKQALERHQLLCANNEICRMVFPKYDKLKFYNGIYKSRLPFAIYADFETWNEISPSPATPQNTTILAKQLPFSYGLYIHSDYPEIIKSQYIYHTGTDTIEQFIKLVLQLNYQFQTIFKNYSTNPISCKMSSIDKEAFANTEICHFCKQQANPKVADHNHYDGTYRGVSCISCNKREGDATKFVPIYFHNLSGYDAHLFIKELAQKQNKFMTLKVLAKSKEDYISFQFGKLRFLDSLRFFQSSLENVAKSLTDEQLKVFATRFKKGTFPLMRQKGFYPYDYMTDISKYEEKELPPQEAFYSKLKGAGISDEDYEHAKKVWKTFKCETFLDYHKLYQKTDVLLLADCFENFRDFFMKNHEIDPAHCYSTPGLTWQCGFKMTKVELDIIKDSNMLMLMEQGIRGGFSGVLGKRIVKANNKYLPDFDPTKPSNYLLYLDANNLYGWAMSQPLPTNDFKWEDDLEYYKHIPKGRGCFITCDLKYTTEAQIKTQRFPLAPERCETKEGELSNYQKEILVSNDEKLGKVKKLLLNLHDKHDYTVHHKLLEFYESKGLIVTKVHSIISFNETKWLKPYIEFNTNQRTKANTNFEKDIWKLMNNSFYGKTCENIRGRVDIQIHNDKNKVMKEISHPKFKDSIILNEDLIIIVNSVLKQKFDKPIYTGFSVLEYAKLLMYNFYYDVVEKQWPYKNEIMYGDTDSLMLNIQTDDVYKDLDNILHELDTSDYPTTHPLFSNENKKVIGKFKDEKNGKIIVEIICHRSKEYSIRTLGEEEDYKKLKGISKNVIKKEIKHEDYEETFKTGKNTFNKMMVLNSDYHQMYLKEVNKKSLCAFDSKRYILDGGVDTIPYAPPAFTILSEIIHNVCSQDYNK